MGLVKRGGYEMCRVYRVLNISAALAVATAGVALADSWLAATEQDYYAVNEAYYLHVVPGDGSTPARGTLYHLFVGGGEEEVWSRDLENAVAPVTVLISGDGRYVVTSDDWGGVGYGPNVVVIYGPEGVVVKKFALEDLLTEAEIAIVPHSTSSRWWRGEHELDETNDVVILKVIAGGMTEEGKARTRDLRVALATGEVLP
ncbi:MAG: hypothetical protein V3W11_03990 [bacterium]